MKSRDAQWSVGEIADRFGLETHVLRYWEDRGLLTPSRNAAGRRLYCETTWSASPSSCAARPPG